MLKVRVPDIYFLSLTIAIIYVFHTKIILTTTLSLY